jgi:energy-coupling factor transporter ATP-binding protein EcfA2
MAPRPEILLLDEPFSSMDADLREQLAREVRDLLRREGVTAILVTHDQLEAFAMADLIGVLGHGRIHQWGTGFALYHEPVDRFVAISSARASCCPRTVHDAYGCDRTRGSRGRNAPHGLAPGQRGLVLIRPDDLMLRRPARAGPPWWAAPSAAPSTCTPCGWKAATRVLCLVPSHHPTPSATTSAFACRRITWWCSRTTARPPPIRRVPIDTCRGQSPRPCRGRGRGWHRTRPAREGWTKPLQPGMVAEDRVSAYTAALFPCREASGPHRIHARDASFPSACSSVG